MREILFRGKRTDNGEWVEGNLIKMAAGDVAIMSTDVFDLVYVIANKVDPSTVGQFTGLYDKHGKRIFEGDVVASVSGMTFEVKFGEGSFYMDGTAITIHHAKRFTVIGNIHDNPELLEGGGEDENR